ncbi:putative general amino acid permease (Agp2) [Aspergillus brunneoviolaceus CBS 621.78]|uniref:General amino acid permease AGP2 n=1 Tax=Aspergillus brunneoviolaceus CBS 621.78 TaxID=1450534 RepID=A0ACD1FX02_9EURO|nr:general amino acid permease AGP2 [Aspergillus brunneoviolaceus CBS 621.78]RAH41498.1 general amino acid permease AGP2 [Aspergillus brunneoviolaceus CBS 621.78]
MTIATIIHEGRSPTIDCPDSKHAASHQEPHEKGGVVNGSEESAVCSNTFASDHTHRKLKPRHIQLIGIGGTIGTALYVQIGKGLMHGGPGSLFLAFLIWSLVILCITVCLAEMVTYLPISSPFIRFAGRYVDEAFGVAAGYNFFIFEAVMVPFEVTACNMIINYWSDVVPVAGIVIIVLALYVLLNLFAVEWYGESEFWLSLSKVLLSVGLIFFTFIVMVGGNPLGDRFGFRYWRNPGAFAEYYKPGDLGRWLGFLACLIQASFTIAGPDYVSMAAGEAVNPRGVLPKAYNGIFLRLTAFFVLGVLCIGILVPYNDPEMAAAFEQDLPGAASSPYVIAMNRLQIPVLPHIVNAMILLASFSAGNSYVYCASRSLYGLALDGKAPRILTKCTKKGIPIYCVLVVLLISLLAFLQVSNGSAVVLNWFVSLMTASQLINFSVITFTYTRFRKALIVQGVARQILPYRSWGQPYVAYIALVSTFVMTFVGGYTVFLPGNWDVPTFLFSYTMIAVFPIIYVGYKLFCRTKLWKPEEVDIMTGVDDIDEYTKSYVEVPSRNPFSRFGDWLFG